MIVRNKMDWNPPLLQPTDVTFWPDRAHFCFLSAQPRWLTAAKTYVTIGWGSNFRVCLSVKTSTINRKLLYRSNVFIPTKCTFNLSLYSPVRYLQQNLLSKMENLEHLQQLDTLNVSNNTIYKIENISKLAAVPLKMLFNNTASRLAGLYIPSLLAKQFTHLNC